MLSIIIVERITQQSAAIEFKLVPTSSGVCVTCTFLDNSTADCVLVVHQRISQLSSSGLMDIRSRKFTRLDDSAEGCIEDVDLEQHQVGIINGRRAPPIRDPDGMDLHVHDRNMRAMIIILNIVAVRKKGSPLAGAIVGTGNTFFGIIITYSRSYDHSLFFSASFNAFSDDSDTDSGGGNVEEET